MSEIQELQEQINTLIEKIKPFEGMRERIDKQFKDNRQQIELLKEGGVSLEITLGIIQNHTNQRVLQLENHAESMIKILEGVLSVLSALTNKEEK